MHFLPPIWANSLQINEIQIKLYDIKLYETIFLRIHISPIKTQTSQNGSVKGLVFTFPDQIFFADIKYLAMRVNMNIVYFDGFPANTDDCIIVFMFSIRPLQHLETCGLVPMA